jgi:hypothetical protein
MEPAVLLYRFFAANQDNPHLSPTHMSLYLALFYEWLRTEDGSRVAIDRHTIMKRARIGSSATYTKCIKDLDRWGAICYQPARHRYEQTTVSLYARAIPSPSVAPPAL